MRTSLRVLISLWFLAAATSAPKPTTVCEILADDPTKLKGKVLSVRGVLAGTDEGLWLRDRCETHLVTKGMVWPDQLSVYVDGQDESVMRSWSGLLAEEKRQHVNYPQDKVWVTILGSLETRGSMSDEVAQMPYGLARAGFGHMGSSAAEINVISVGDVVVERPRAGKTGK